LDNTLSLLLRERIGLPLSSPKTGDINPQISHWNNGKIKSAYNYAYVQTGTFKTPPQSQLVRAPSPPSWQRMDSSAACATICPMATADKSNHWSTGTLHPHHTDGHTMMTYTVLNFPTDQPKEA